MARLMQEDARAYRAVVKRTDKETKEARVFYYGPYASKGTAKGQATLICNDRERWDSGAVYAGWVQAASGHWMNTL